MTPATRSLLMQKLGRFKDAVEEIRKDLDRIESDVERLRHDLMMVVAALDAEEQDHPE